MNRDLGEGVKITGSDGLKKEVKEKVKGTKWFRFYDFITFCQTYEFYCLIL